MILDYASSVISGSSIDSHCLWSHPIINVTKNGVQAGGNVVRHDEWTRIMSLEPGDLLRVSINKEVLLAKTMLRLEVGIIHEQTIIVHHQSDHFREMMHG